MVVEPLPVGSESCELAKAECLPGNAVLPGIIREVCEDLNIPWGYVSSGCIFSERRQDGRVGQKKMNPIFHFDYLPAVFTVVPRL